MNIYWLVPIPLVYIAGVTAFVYALSPDKFGLKVGFLVSTGILLFIGTVIGCIFMSGAGQ